MRPLAIVPLPLQAAQRITADLHLEQLYTDGGASFENALAVIDTRSLATRLLPHGSGVLVDPLTHWYWSGNYGGRFVVVRNGHSDAELGRVPVPGCPFGFAQHGGRVWVAQQCDDHISVIDARTRRVIRNVRLPTLSRTEVGGAKGMGEIVINSNTGIVYFWKDMIPHRLDPRTWRIEETPQFDGPVIGVNEPHDRLYARVDYGLQVVDGSSERVVAHVRLPATPTRITVGFGGDRVYVGMPGYLAVLDGRSHRVLAVLEPRRPFNPHAITVDEPAGRVYLLDAGRAGEHALVVLRLPD